MYQHVCTVLYDYYIVLKHTLTIIPFHFLLSEALPFFLLLMDLSKATSLAEYASKARSKVSMHVMLL